MMAVGHSLSGWCAGLLAGTVIGADLPLTLEIAGALAGAALLPDLDHPGSTATTAFGGLSYLAHRGVIGLHHATCAALRRPTDGKDPGAHRGVTHWWPFPLVIGGLIAVLCTVTPWATLALLAILFTLTIRGISVPEYRTNTRHSIRRRAAIRAAHGVANLVPTIAALHLLRRWVGRTGRAGVLLAASIAAYVATTSGSAGTLGPWMGLIVGGGIALHVAGDWPTESKVPGLRLWSEWGLPKWLAFKAGGWFEVVFLWVPFSVAGLVLIPGALPMLLHASHGITEALR